MVGALVTNELHDLPVRCDPSEFATFQPPSGQTCAQWAAPFVDAVGGYLRDPNATSDCGYCQFSVGDDFYGGLEISFSERYRNVGEWTSLPLELEQTLENFTADYLEL